MSSRKYQPPYRMLGRYLKTMRQQLQETLGETSGAVEIEVDALDRIERGDELPSEDVLLLLMSHFNIQDDEAVQLWDLAGYAQPDNYIHGNDDGWGQAGKSKQTPTMVMLAFDTRVLYSNSAEIVSDDTGLTLNFGQTIDPDKPPLPVSRIGMSYEQAERLMATLQRVLLRRKYGTGSRLLGDGN